MGIILSTNFDVGVGLPLDSKTIVNLLTDRDNIPIVQRYIGLEVRVLEDNAKYVLEGGTANENWVLMVYEGGSLWNKIGATNDIEYLGGNVEISNTLKVDIIEEYMLNNGILLGNTLTVDQENSRIGVNQDTPLSTLDVLGTFRAGSSNGGIRFADDATTAYLQALSSLDGVRPMNLKAEYLKFYTGSSTYGTSMLITSSGNVEILNTLLVDTISEYTTDAGVTIESILLKDGRAINSTDAAPTTDPELANKKYVDDNINSGDYLDYVLAMQFDDTTNPTSSPTIGDRYIILDTSDIHDYFKGNYADLATWIATEGVANNDIVEWNGTNFTVTFDASIAVAGVTVTVGIDKNLATDHQWYYSTSDVEWLDRGDSGFEDLITNLFPIGLEGNVFFINEDNQRTTDAGFTVVKAMVVENDVELTAAQGAVVTIEDIFNDWDRFSHWWPHDTWSVEWEHSSNYSPTNYPALDPLSDDGYALTQATWDAGGTWVYNSGANTISTTANYVTYIGFYSPSVYDTYELNVEMSSTHYDDDAMTIVLATYEDEVTGYRYTLDLVRNYGTISNSYIFGPNYGIVFNNAQNPNSSIGSLYTNSYDPVYADQSADWLVDASSLVTTSGSGWNTAGKTKVYVQRDGDVFTIKIGQQGSSSLDDDTLLVYDLKDNAKTLKFRGPRSFGFGAQSQANATFSSLTFSGFSNYIFYNKDTYHDTYEYDDGTSTWSVQSPQTVTLHDYVGTGRIVDVDDYNKLYYTEYGGLISKLGGSSDGSAFSGGAYLSREITQTSHGFSNDFVYYNGTTWAKAQADAASTCATHFAVNLGTDLFELIPVGEIDNTTITDDASAALTVGKYYFLSQSTAGKTTATKPSSNIVQSLLKVNGTGKISISIQEPYDISDVGGGGEGVTTFLQLTDTPASYTANKWLQVNSGGTALELVDAPGGSGTVTSVTSSTTGQLTVANGTTTPALSIVTAGVVNDGAALATGNQIYDFVIGRGYSTTTGTVTSITAGNGMSFTTINSSGSVVLGTPGTSNQTDTNSVTSTSHTHNILDAYSALSFSSSITWNCSTGVNKTLTSTGNFTLSLTNKVNGMSGDLRLNVTGTTTITLPTSKLNGSVTSLATGIYHLAWVYDGTNVEFNIAKYE